jgi:hypothetical protein
MPLPAAWVDSLFARLTVRYGAAFLRQYPDIDPAAVKADWAAVLDGFERYPDGLKYAVDNLPETPLNALQFRAIARRGPAPEPVAKLPEAPADPERVAAAVERLTAARPSRRSASLAQDCIDRVELCVESRGGKIDSMQRHMVAHCLRVSGTSTKLPVLRANHVPAEVEAAQ